MRGNTLFIFKSSSVRYSSRKNFLLIMGVYKHNYRQHLYYLEDFSVISINIDSSFPASLAMKSVFCLNVNLLDTKKFAHP